MKVELSLGSNTNAEVNMARAKELLAVLLPGIAFGETVWTAPYPTKLVPHPTKKYLNCLAAAETALTQDELVAALKQLERQMGDSHENHKAGRVLIDVDLLSYNGLTVKEKRW